MIDLGGIAWSFNIKYGGGSDAKQAAKDLLDIAKTIKHADDAANKYSTALSELSKAQRDADASLGASAEKNSRLATATLEAAKAQQALTSALGQLESMAVKSSSAFNTLDQQIKKVAEDAKQTANYITQTASELNKALGFTPSGAIRDSRGRFSSRDKGDPTLGIGSYGPGSSEGASFQDVNALLGVKAAATDLSGAYLGLTASTSSAAFAQTNLAQTLGQVDAKLRTTSQDASFLASVLSNLGQGRIGPDNSLNPGSLAAGLMAKYGSPTYPEKPDLTLPTGFAGSPTRGADLAAAAKYDILARAAERSRGAISEFTGSMRTDIATQKEKTGVNKTLSSTFDSLSTSVSLAATALASMGAAFAASNLLDFLKEVTLLAGRVDNLKTVLENVGSISGYTQGTIANLEEQVRALGITTQEARQSLALLAQGEIDLSQAAQLARIAQDAAVIAGINSSEAFDRLVVGIQRTNTWMLRNLGIMVNLNNVYRDFAISNGRVITTLSTQEKQQLLINEVMRKGALIQGTYEAALQDTYKQYTSLDRVIEETKRELGEEFQPVFEYSVQTVYKLLQAFRDADGDTKAFIAACLAGTTAALSLAASLGTLAVALYAVRAAAGDVTALLMLLGTVTTGLAVGAFVGFSATVHNAKVELEEASEAGQAYASATGQLAKAFTQLSNLEAKTQGNPLSPEQLSEVRGIISQIIARLPELAAEFQRMDPNNPREIAEYLYQVRNAVAQTSTERLAALNDELQALGTNIATQEAELKRLKEESTKASSTSADPLGSAIAAGMRDLFDTDAVSVAENKLQELEKRRANLEGQIKEETLSTAGDQARLFEEQVKKQETAYNLALRLENQFNDKRVNVWEEANLKIYQDYKKNIDQLSTYLLSLEDVEKGIEASLIVRLAELEDAFAKQEKEANGDATLLDKIAKRREAQTANLRAEAELRKQDLLDQAAQIRESINLVSQTTALEIEKAQKERELQEYRTGLVEKGEDDRIAALRSGLRKQEAIRKTAEEGFKRSLEVLKKEEQELRAVLRDSVDEEKKRGAQFSLDKNLTAQKTLELVRVNAAQEAAAKIKEIEQDLANRRKEILEKFTKEIADLEDKRADLARRRSEVEFGIEMKLLEEKLRLRKRDIELAREALDEEKKRIEGFGKAQKEAFDNRVKQINMEREFGRLIAQGVAPGAARAMVMQQAGMLPVGQQMLVDLMKKRLDEIEKKREALDKAAKDIKDAEEKVHRAKVEVDLEKARTQRDEIIAELKRIRIELEKAEKERAKAEGRALADEGPADKKARELREKIGKATDEQLKLIMEEESPDNPIGDEDTYKAAQAELDRREKKQQEAAAAKRLEEAEKKLKEAQEGAVAAAKIPEEKPEVPKTKKELLEEEMKRRRDAFAKEQERRRDLEKKRQELRDLYKEFREGTIDKEGLDRLQRFKFEEWMREAERKMLQALLDEYEKKKKAGTLPKGLTSTTIANFNRGGFTPDVTRLVDARSELSTAMQYQGQSLASITQTAAEGFSLLAKDVLKAADQIITVRDTMKEEQSTFESEFAAKNL